MQTKTKKQNASALVLAKPMLPQIVAQLGARAHRAGKEAYDYLGTVQPTGALATLETLSMLKDRALTAHNLGDPVCAALAAASAALMDVGHNRRLTGAERIDEAMELLHTTLDAGL